MYALAQALLPDVLRQENIKIEGQLTKFQNNLRTLVQLKEDIGTEKDNDDLRQRITAKQEEISQLAKTLQTAIDEYSNISVPYRSQRQQQEKKEAYSKRLLDSVNKYKQETQEIALKLQQHIELVKRRQSLMYNESDSNLHRDEENQQLVQLDMEELKVQGEAAYMEDVIKQRQEELNNVEQFTTDINHIAKDINTKIHDQRGDLVEIEANTGTALDNAKEAEKNIEEAQEH